MVNHKIIIEALIQGLQSHLRAQPGKDLLLHSSDGNWQYLVLHRLLTKGCPQFLARQFGCVTLNLISLIGLRDAQKSNTTHFWVCVNWPRGCSPENYIWH